MEYERQESLRKRQIGAQALEFFFEACMRMIQAVIPASAELHILVHLPSVFNPESELYSDVSSYRLGTSMRIP